MLDLLGHFTKPTWGGRLVMKKQVNWNLILFSKEKNICHIIVHCWEWISLSKYIENQLTFLTCLLTKMHRFGLQVSSVGVFWMTNYLSGFWITILLIKNVWLRVLLTTEHSILWREFSEKLFVKKLKLRFIFKNNRVPLEEVTDDPRGFQIRGFKKN